MDPMVQLALAVYQNKGTYALLLGSGVSRAAGMPTGWEVILDLIRRVAHLSGEAPEPDPVTWFRSKYGEEPDYSTIIERLAATPAERRALLRNYFEPSDEERAEGRKLPTRAHRSIARLASKGYVRVVLQTNFDTLTEDAMREEGIRPAVLSSPDSIHGAIPLAHEPVTVVKLHGDYLDTRVLNTRGELERYNENTDRLLDRVLDEYGLIICGWSGDWDDALVAAIERNSARRYTTFWAVRGALTDRSARLAETRHGVLVRIEDADSFFGALSEQVEGLERLAGDHPLSPALAMERVKRLLSDGDEIFLNDLVQGEVEALYRRVSGRAREQSVDAANVTSEAAWLEDASGIVLALVATLAVWGRTDADARMLKRAILRLGGVGSDSSVWTKMHRYPALLALYCAGLASVAAPNVAQCVELLTCRETSRADSKLIVEVLAGRNVLPTDIVKLLPELGSRKTPLSDRLHDALREPLRSLIPDDKEYEGAFDYWEYLLSLAFMDAQLQRGRSGWAPLGQFAWKDLERDGPHPQRDIAVELSSFGADWPYLRAGLFGRDLERAKKAIELLNEQVRQSGLRF